MIWVGLTNLFVLDLLFIIIVCNYFSEAAEVLRNNRRLFEQNVQKAMRGGYVGSCFFERCLVK